ncbi:N-formylglutamate amidohydrolase [Sphingomonas sp. AX6]|uniref:N-formylglutamate amidohydrolase n=1 Tax=Sphingomonas sp. AX6 TaxID=2653171 RepID=UPI0012F222BA|nr:N-formylglutamate amidohydrolase [Sphingomonas sp. AX6]VXD00293.1 N-formylglutamate amidohydrolase [Sphingomonas sp. AX6]
MDDAAPAISFDRHGPVAPRSPVLLSVPHAGRDYPPALIDALGVPFDQLLPLEDRHVDSLALLARRAETLFVARRPRAWIDLNRGEHERDPAVDLGADAKSQPGGSSKLRGGLGLVPRRASGATLLWRRRFSGEEVAARIAADHRPYHAALAAALRSARDAFGRAVLLDIHSMPPIEAPDPARIVIGDRFGRSASAPTVALVESVIRSHGVRFALNSPYAGGHILDTHGNPTRGIDAIQIEIDRTLYLDANLDQPGAGLAATAGLLRSIISAVADEITALPRAAE